MPLPQVNDPTGLFNQSVAAGDMSGQMLKALFGEDWQTIGQVVGGGASADAASLLLTLLAAMSTVALAIGAAIMIYTIFMGVIGTAHEGSPMGRKMHTIWTPIRGALSVAMLIPTAKGLSVLMVIVLACVGGSVNFANYLANKGYDYLQEHGGQVVVTAPHSMRKNIEDVAVGAAKTMATQYYMNYKLGHDFDAVWRLIPPTADNLEYVIQFQPPLGKTSGLTTADMGAIRIPCNTVGDKLCKARAIATAKMLKDLVPTAHTLAARMMSEQEREESNVPDPGKFDRDAIIGAVDNYVSQISPYISEIVKESDPAFQRDLRRFSGEAKNGGWLLLGSYYWTLSRFTQHVHEITGNMPTITPADPKVLSQAAWNDPAFDALWESSAERVRAQLDSAAVVARGGVENERGKIQQKVQDLASNALGFGEYGPVGAVVKPLMTGDPVTVLSDWGHGIMTSVTTLWVTVVAAKSVAAGVDATAGGIWADAASGGLAGGASRVALSIIKDVTALVMLVALPMIAVGIFLAYYLPALPFILWISSIVGWLILVVEALFAAPLWAVAHMVPEGDGMAGQHGRQGYMLLFGVLVRPPLMVAGFFTAMILMTLVGRLVGGAFLIYYNAVSAGQINGITTWVVQSVLMCGVMVILAHKIFGLITHLPDKVITWIGGQAGNIGTDESEARAKTTVMAGGGIIQKTAGESMSGAGQAAVKGAAGGGSGDGADTTEKLVSTMSDSSAST